jgi:hypothetical protein
VVSEGGLPEKPVTGDVRQGVEVRVGVKRPKSVTRIMLVESEYGKEVVDNFYFAEKVLFFATSVL